MSARRRALPEAVAAGLPPVSILAAMEDEHLFARHFRGATWDAWKVVLAAIFALPMTEAQEALYREHTGRTALPDEAFREAALVVGRRGGKSRILALLAAYLATFRDYAPHLAPGEVATVAVVAADRRQARSIFRYTKALLLETPLLAGLVSDETAETLGLTNRVVIEIATAGFRVTRGYTYAAVLADETAFWRDDDSRNPAEEIFRALRPGLATIPGAMLLQGSSPYRKQGLLYNTWRRHHGKNDGRVLTWQASTSAMNPAVDPAIIAEAYDDDPVAAAAEYGAEFRDDLSDFVSREVVDGVVVPGRYELLPQHGRRYVAFTDPSGGSSDSMTLAIAHAEGQTVVLDLVREHRAPFSPEVVVADFAETLRRYGVREVRGDRYGGEWPRERFRTHGVTYELAEKPRSDLYLDTLPLLNSGRCELLDLPRLVTQFCALERRTSRAGRDSIDHPPGGHDDVANAVAGALLMCVTAKPAPLRATPLRI